MARHCPAPGHSGLTVTLARLCPAARRSGRFLPKHVSMWPYDTEGDVAHGRKGRLYGALSGF